MSKATYFGLHYLYFLVSIFLGFVGLLMADTYMIKVIFPKIICMVFIIAGILGIVIITVELILYLKGENTD